MIYETYRFKAKFSSPPIRPFYRRLSTDRRMLIWHFGSHHSARDMSDMAIWFSHHTLSRPIFVHLFVGCFWMVHQHRCLCVDAVHHAAPRLGVCCIFYCILLMTGVFWSQSLESTFSDDIGKEMVGRRDGWMEGLGCLPVRPTKECPLRNQPTVFFITNNMQENSGFLLVIHETRIHYAPFF